jgi:multiple sugar transport system substrate-binding protein
LTSAQRAVEAAKQYAGITLNVPWESGLQAQDPILYSGPEFEKLTGVKINPIETSFTDMVSKYVTEHIGGTGAYDVISISPAWLPDMVEAGVLEPLDPYMDQYMDKSELDDLPPTFRGFQQYNGQTYGLYDDGDVFIMYYRTDWFNDEKNKADYKAKTGKDLVVPETIEDFTSVCTFFTEQYSAEGKYGCQIQRAAGSNYHWFYQDFVNSCGRFFDDNMKATINNEIGVKTLQNMVDQNSFMPPGAETADFVQVLSSWLSGDLGMIITWPPIGRWSEGYGTQTAQLSWVPKTNVAGQVGYAVSPGGHSNLAGAYMLGVSPDSKNKEAAYLFIQWLTSKDVSLERVKLPFALRDPYRESHYTDTLYRNLWPNAPQYLDTLKLAAETGMSDLILPGVTEMEASLDRAVTAAMGGADPKAALDTSAQEWDETVQRIGVDKVKAAYDDWVARLGPNAYPPECQ